MRCNICEGVRYSPRRVPRGHRLCRAGRCFHCSWRGAGRVAACAPGALRREGAAGERCGGPGTAHAQGFARHRARKTLGALRAGLSGPWSRAARRRSGLFSLAAWAAPGAGMSVDPGAERGWETSGRSGETRGAGSSGARKGGQEAGCLVCRSLSQLTRSGF